MEDIISLADLLLTDNIFKEHITTLLLILTSDILLQCMFLILGMLEVAGQTHFLIHLMECHFLAGSGTIQVLQQIIVEQAMGIILSESSELFPIQALL